jgi:hypothetical protein
MYSTATAVRSTAPLAAVFSGCCAMQHAYVLHIRCRISNSCLYVLPTQNGDAVDFAVGAGCVVTGDWDCGCPVPDLTGRYHMIKTVP